MTEENENPASQKSQQVYNPPPIERQEHREGSLTQVLEQQTAKLPSSVFLAASIASMLASATLEATGHHWMSQFVGMWAPALLMMGVYNKLLKMFGPR